MDPADQAGVDKVLSEESTLSEAARLAVSMAVCRAGAKQANQEVFQYIAEMADNYNVCTPVPHVCVLEGGRSASNKLVVKVSEARRAEQEEHHSLYCLLNRFFE